jgi:NADH-quinone oxidoreductase subunit C
MQPLEIYQRVKARFAAKVLELVEKPPDPFIVIDPAALVDICRFLKDEPELDMDCLSNQSGVDFKDNIQVVYHLFSYRLRHSAVLKVKLARDNPHVPTLEGLWKSANWMEREIFDLLGVHIDGHSDLRRILMPEDWPGYPLRKDFVEPLEYHGISTTRESPIIRLEKKK